MSLHLSRVLIPTVAVYALSAFALTGCTSTQLVESWRSDEIGRSGYSKVLMVGVAQRPETRRLFEDDFVSAAGKRGYTVLRSYSHIPDVSDINRPNVERVAKELGCDGILIARLVDVDRDALTPPTYYGPPLGTRGSYLDDNYEGQRPNPRPYQLLTFNLQADLYDVTSAHLAWSARTQTVDPRNLSADVSAWSDVIIKAMVAEHALVATKSESH